VAPLRTPEDELAHTQRERDLYARFLRLGDQREIEPLLREALGLVVEYAGAAQGYIELVEDVDGTETTWSIAHSFSPEEVDTVRLMVSHGIIAEAISKGETIRTPFALLDARFADRDSVQRARLEAVLCAPIATDRPLGVIYLHGRRSDGFSENTAQAVEHFARNLVPFVERLIDQLRLRSRNDHTREIRTRLRIPEVIGQSTALAATLKQVALAAPLDIGVLLLGDTGTGKSQLARVLHDNSPRAHGPFVELNCAALPETLIESELFGALPGAHSGATQRVAGKVAAATRGTLMLDEVSELPLQAQGKLLQLLQSKQYFPLGGTQLIEANVRIIAAANVDLQAAVAARRFREDLYYRLNILPIRVPALAERRSDITLLAEEFCRATSAGYGLRSVRLSPGALRALETAEWPGNIRQLKHTVQAATIRAAGERSGQIERRHLFATASSLQGAPVEDVTWQEATHRFQAQLLETTLREHSWNVRDTAQRLDVARSHLYTLMHAFGLERRSG
jgi:Nif-specific regulatory protein